MILALFILLQSALASPCQEYLRIDTRLQQRSRGVGTGCGPEGYLQAYGYHYCQVFVEAKEEFLLESQEILARIRSCLIRQIKVREKKLNCHTVKDLAYATHTPCYVQSGYCEMDSEDRANLKLHLSDQIFNPRAWEELFRLHDTCSRRDSRYIP